MQGPPARSAKPRQSLVGLRPSTSRASARVLHAGDITGSVSLPPVRISGRVRESGRPRAARFRPTAGNYAVLVLARRTQSRRPCTPVRRGYSTHGAVSGYTLEIVCAKEWG